MKRTEQEKLLAEILSGEELSDFRQESLERAITSLARQRRHRRILRACAWASLPLLLAVAILAKPAHLAQAPVPSGAAALASAVSQAQPVKFINDEELLALFPDRPVALIGEPGHQQLVFLDEPAASPAAPSEEMN